MALAGTTATVPVQAPPRTSTSVVKKWLSTTPGKLRGLSLLIVIAALVSVVAGLGAGTQRRHGISTAANQAEPLLVSAQEIHTSLAKADAAAATAFLAGGVEPVAARTAYTDSIATASEKLATATEQAGSSKAATAAIQVITTQLPVYAGLVESARANNRQGFPIGAAYLRQASDLMNRTGDPKNVGILEAVDQLSSDAQRRFDDAKNTATSPVGIALAVVAVLAFILVMAVTGLFLFRRTNRVLNVGLAIGGVAALLWLGWAASSAASQADKVHGAQTNGADSVRVIAEARILAFKAKGDESLSLITHGNGADLDADFEASRASVIDNGDKSLLDLADRLADAGDNGVEHAQLSKARANFTTYIDVHRKILEDVKTGDFNTAIATAISQDPGSGNDAFDAFDKATTEAIDANQKQFLDGMSDARGALLGLNPFAVILLVIAAGAALWGVQQRINEYR